MPIELFDVAQLYMTRIGTIGGNSNNELILKLI